MTTPEPPPTKAHKNWKPVLYAILVPALFMLLAVASSSKSTQEFFISISMMLAFPSAIFIAFYSTFPLAPGKSVFLALIKVTVLTGVCFVGLIIGLFFECAAIGITFNIH